MHEFSTLVELLRHRAQHDPDKTAFTFLRDGEIESEVLTYLELDRRARAIAAKLQSLGAEGQRALLLYSPNLTFITAFLGCLYAKVLAVPAYPPRPNQTMTRLRSMMTDAGATVALTTQQLLGNFGKLLDKNPDFAGLNWVTTDGLRDDLATAWHAPSLDPSTLAFLQYTSGSTGLPKGVMVSHDNLLHNAQAIHERFNDTARTVGVSWLPPYHDMGLIGGILQPIYLNIPSVLMAPVSFLQRPFRWLQAISRYRGTTSGGPNFAYDLCLRQVTPEQRETLDLSSWSLAFSGAEPVRAETIQRFSQYFEPCGFRPEAFYPCYGMAEATLFVSGGDRAQTPTCTTVKGTALEQNTVVPSEMADLDPAVVSRAEGDRRQLVGCGVPAAAQHITIVNPSTLEPCTDLEVGEIWVSGPNIAQGYWNRPQQTQETFQARLAATGEGPFLRTGDLGFIKDGELFVTGRLKDLIVIRGLNHYPQDIEATVGESHDQIRAGQGAAFSVEVENDIGVREERLVIVQEVERSALRRLKTDEVVTAIKQAVAQHHTLQTYAVLLLKTGSIPKTSSGKIQRHACKQGFRDQSLTVVGQWLESDQPAHMAAPLSQGGSVPIPNASSPNASSPNTSSPNASSPDPLLQYPSPQNTPSQNTPSQNTPSPSTPSLLPDSLPFARRRLRLPQAGAIASIQTWLVTQVARMLKVTPDMIDIHEPLARYGLDSIAAVRLSGALEDWLGRSLSPTLAYDYPSIAALSKYLSTEPTDLADAATVSRAQRSPYKRRTTDDEIAIIGMGCRLPGANNPDEFWQLLHQGRDAITELGQGDRWSGHSQAKVGGFLQQTVDCFDPQFFGISPREANRMDPQQRLLLEVSWEALEQAGIAPTTLAGTTTGVFVGISSNDYAQLQAREMGTDPYSGTGNAHSIAANRLSYVLDLRGPSLTVDTACSSSLVALHTACQSLQQGDCDQAIAAGVNLILAPDLTLTFAEAGMLAADGHCKTFSADADGYVRGEGCGAIVLKRVSDAKRDGDTILAVIKGSAINQDGRSNGLTAPNGLSQQAVIQSALQRAGVSAADISYVDAHGTGTVLGDPIELNALKAVLMQGRTADQQCWIGSVKTNIGHLEAAAGMASVIKVVLALNHQEIPPHLHVTELNPHVSWDHLPLAVPTRPQPWPASAPLSQYPSALSSRSSSGSVPVPALGPPSGQRLAGVSSFGFGGTNAHVILSDASETGLRTELGNESQSFSAPTHHLLTISAKTSAALDDLAQAYVDFLDTYPDESLANICATAHMGRSHFARRLAILATSLPDLKHQLIQGLNSSSNHHPSQGSSVIRSSQEVHTSTRIAFLFTGQGSQYENMGYDLYQSQPVFRRVIDECDRILQTYLEYPLLHVLYPEERRKAGDERPLPPDLIHQTLYTQPALFAVELALAELWQSWGIYPDVVMGHSVGEYVAACVADIFSIEDGLKLIAGRSRLMQNLPANGAMVAVFASEQQVTDVLHAHTATVGPVAVDIAAINGPDNVVISGERQAVETVVTALNAQGLTTKPLKVSHAFHSVLMNPMLPNFEAIAHTIRYQAPQIPIISNVSGKLVSPELDTVPMATPSYWSRHIRQPVQFSQSIATLFELGYQTLLEVGPKPTLLGMAQRCLPSASPSPSSPSHTSVIQWLYSLRPNQPNWFTMLRSAAQLYVHSYPLNWNGIAAGQPIQRLHHLPTYPWQRQRCWFTDQWDATPLSAAPLSATPLSATLAQSANVGEQPPYGRPSQPSTEYYTLEWHPRSKQASIRFDESTDGPVGGWIIALASESASPMADAIALQLHAAGQTPWTMVLPETLELTVEQLKQIANQHNESFRLPNPVGTRHNPEAIAPPPIHGLIFVAPSVTASITPDVIDYAATGAVSTCAPVLRLLQALLHVTQSSSIWQQQSPRLWLVTQGSVVTGSEYLQPESSTLNPAHLNPVNLNPVNLNPVNLNPVNLDQSTLWGLGKVIALEHPEIWGGLIDLDLIDLDLEHPSPDLKTEKNPSMPTIAPLVQECLYSDGEGAIAFRQGQRYVQRLVPYSNSSLATPSLPTPSLPTPSLPTPSPSTYLITGGLGSLGLTVAQWLVDSCHITHLTLMGRRHPSAEAQVAIASLEAKGATVYTVQADVSQVAEVAAVLQQIRAQGLALKGIIHAAGVLQDGMLENQTWDSFATVLAPKVQGAWHLHQLSQTDDLDFFVLFSSVASLLGSPGQGNYAAANAFMDRLAQYRRRQGQPALSINWGPWASGMALQTGLSERLVRSGFDLMAPAQGLAHLSELLFSGNVSSNASSNELPTDEVPAQLGILSARWFEIRKRLTPAQQLFLSPVLDHLDSLEIANPHSPKQDAPTPVAAIHSFTVPQPMERLLARPEGDRATVFTDYLQTQISQVLQLSSDQLSVTSNLMDVGMDSLMVMEAINQLRQDFGLMLYPREFYEYPTIQALATYLAQEFNRTHTSSPPESSTALTASASSVLIPTLTGTSDQVSLHRGDRLPPAVFILSSPRSGSTLLRVMLAGHSRLLATPELHLLPFDTMVERQQQLGDSHLSEGLERSLMELNQWDGTTSRDQVTHWLEQNATVADVYAALQQGAGDRILVDKSPTYAMHRPTLDRAEALFQNAKYIHLVRHPYSVLESFVRMRMDKLLGIAAADPYQLAEQIWQQSNQNILDFAQTIGPERYHLIQYEALVRDPSTVLSQLCQFLEIELEPSLLNPYDGDRMTDGVHNASMSLGDPNFLRHQRIDPALADAWKTIELPQPLNNDARAIAQTLNYSLSPKSPLPLSPESPLPLSSSPLTPSPTPSIQPTEYTVEANGLTHTLCTWGDDDAPPIFCIHGILDQGLIWHPVAQSLVQQGYRVIAPDLRGHGRSTHVGPGGSYHLLDFLTDIDTLITHLYPPTSSSPTPSSSTPSPSTPSPPTPPFPHPITLVGHSMGSIIAALYASSRPERVRSLFMVETILPADKRPHVTEQLTTVLNAPSQTPSHPIFPDVETAARRLRQGTPSLSAPFSYQLAERICTPVVNGGVQWSWDAKLRNRTGIGFSRMPFGRTDYLTLLSQLSLPVTVVYGDRSSFNRPDDLAAQADALSHATRIVLSGGHNLHIDAASELSEVIGGNG